MTGSPSSLLFSLTHDARGTRVLLHRCAAVAAAAATTAPRSPPSFSSLSPSPPCPASFRAASPYPPFLRDDSTSSVEYLRHFSVFSLFLSFCPPTAPSRRDFRHPPVPLAGPSLSLSRSVSLRASWLEHAPLIPPRSARIKRIFAALFADSPSSLPPAVKLKPALLPPRSRFLCTSPCTKSP